jgi:HSP20 family molecular chaperone IbpA
VDVDHIEAELKDGILKVVLPKMQAAERHTVEVA